MKEFTSKKELMEYIGQAIEVESNVLSQQNLIKEYDENREQYKPHLVLQEEPECGSADVSRYFGRSLALWTIPCYRPR